MSSSVYIRLLLAVYDDNFEAIGLERVFLFRGALYCLLAPLESGRCKFSISSREFHGDHML